MNKSMYNQNGTYTYEKFQMGPEDIESRWKARSHLNH